MSNHVHFLSAMPSNRSVAAFVQCLKTGSALRLRRILPDDVLVEFSDQAGLNQRQFWQRSFRSVVIAGEAMFWQKVNYIHDNPVRAGLVERQERFPWSSASLFAHGLWKEGRGIMGCFRGGGEEGDRSSTV